LDVPVDELDVADLESEASPRYELVARADSDDQVLRLRRRVAIHRDGAPSAHDRSLRPSPAMSVVW